MPELHEITGGASHRLSGFEVGWVQDGKHCRARLNAVANVRFELATPARGFRSWRGQRNNTGWWWFATTGKHVGFESWLERDHVMLLDHDPTVVGLASQPFWLFWPVASRTRSHAPDYFARLIDGTGVVVDCRPSGAIRRRDAEAFEATRRACEQIGWHYWLVHEVDSVRGANLRWLSGYRHPRNRSSVAASVLERFAESRPIWPTAAELGDPIAILPVIYHLVWSGELVTDFSAHFGERSMLTAATTGSRVNEQ